MNASTAAARAVVAALREAGVQDVVLCPGSRSAPLAYALAAADAAGGPRLHVRVDERAAGFTALGLALGGPAPAAVVTTSGTAVANLHPAVLEAHESAVPLLVLSADRPHRLRGTWANQTTALQAGLFGGAVRLALDVPAEEPSGRLAGAVRDAVATARGTGGRRPGPVHVDLAFDDPLVPDDDPPAVDDDPLAPGTVAAGPTAPARDDVPDHPDAVVLAAGPRTVVVAGAGAGDDARRLAEAAGWPLLAEPSSGARGGPHAIGPYRLLLDEPGLGGRVERVVVLGRPTLSRPVTRLLARDDVEVVHVVRHADDPRADDPRAGRAVRRVPAVRAGAGGDDGGWLESWRRAGRLATAALDDVLDHTADHAVDHAVDRAADQSQGAPRPLDGLVLAREVARATAPDDVLVAAASNAVRDLDLAGAPWDRPRRVLANRGLSGIDGTLSTASGVALATGRRTRVLVGDLAFLHDLNGLLAGPAEPEPDLQVVLLDDDGGGIFSLLEHGDARFAAVFERVFGTPHGSDVAALCRGIGVPHRPAVDLADLRTALADPPPGRSVLHVRADRSARRDLHARVADAVRVAVNGPR